MIILKVLRLLLVFLIIGVCIFYIKLSRGSIDRRRYIISFAGNPILKIKGDYTGQIHVLEKHISVYEHVSFEKDSLAISIRKSSPVIWGSYGGTISREDSLVSDSIQMQSYLNSYVANLNELGWNSVVSNNSKISFNRHTNLPLSIGVFEKTKRFTIPILFTNVNKVLSRVYNMGFLDKNDSIGGLRYDQDIDYILSDRSKIILQAKEGLIQRIFPEAKKISLIDKDDNEVYLFNLKNIGGALNELELQTTTINFEMINPMYNNTIGKAIRDWSVAQIIVWTIITILALFADKVKELLFKPIVDKLFPKKALPSDPY